MEYKVNLYKLQSSLENMKVVLNKALTIVEALIEEQTEDKEEGHGK